MRKIILAISILVASVMLVSWSKDHLVKDAGDSPSYAVQKKYRSIDELQNGDIIFQHSSSPLTDAIALATRSDFTHVAIIFEIEEKLYAYEAVQPVRLTPVAQWIKRGEGNRYVVKRLKDNSVLTPDVIEKMKTTGLEHKGKDYDGFFEWSDERLYCSELVWKIYHEAAGIDIGRVQKLSEFDLSSPQVKQQLHLRYGNDIPLDEPVVSPVAIYECELLDTVIDKW